MEAFLADFSTQNICSEASVFYVVIPSSCLVHNVFLSVLKLIRSSLQEFAMTTLKEGQEDSTLKLLPFLIIAVHNKNNFNEDVEYL